MCDLRRLPRRRKAFTLIELVVVIFLVVVIAGLGVGYVVFGQDNQHSYVGANTVTSALLNAKQRARRDGVPTGVRLLFGTSGVQATQCCQLELVQQPTDYTAGQTIASANSKTVNFNNQVDFQGGAQYVGEIDESTVEAGDYFWAGFGPPFCIQQVNAQSLTLYSNATVASGSGYSIIRGPRRLPSEDIINMPGLAPSPGGGRPSSPPSMVIENMTFDGISLCQNLPQRTLTDSQNPAGVNVAEIVFAPSGAVVGQGTQADKILLWLRDPAQASPVAGAPAIVSIQIRTGLIGVYPVAPWNTGAPYANMTNDPYLYAKDGRASGM